MYLAESIPWFLKTPPHCKQWSMINLQISSEGCTEPESPYTETRTSSVKQNKISVSIIYHRSLTLYMCMLWILWCLNLKPTFHCNVKPFVLGHRIGLDPKRDHFMFGIPACWFRKSLVDPTQSNTDPTQTLTDQRQTLMDPTGDNGIKVALGPAALVPVLAMYISCFVC